ncbi:hypothetical protein NDR87_34950 [Nocardia sp. CDC159]|uniref:Uncharacterized protein n=1 Tax=Nocardia pulmonis TaxID=2951408 RepID=A0A9X2J220_9NOCA|nr:MULTISPECIES: hypothetical protein [Nocardia]MCM6778690.1 hypothetical protein [Nocardia pulmonis]MCM6791579.1 hypothetical protein [Nocardia sp. CDC159]
MIKVQLAIHVLAVIVAIGPITVAASRFPKAARQAFASGSDRDLAVLRTLHRICRVYTVVAVAIPVFGIATAKSLHVLGSAWLITSMVLTAMAAAVLALVVLPGQSRVLAAFAAEPAGPVLGLAARLAMFTGIFNLLWVVVTVLMIVRPGSTTGV